MVNFKNMLEEILNQSEQVNKNLGNGMNPLMGNGLVSYGTDYKDLVKTEAKLKFNDAVAEKTDEWNQKIKAQVEHARQIDKKMEDMQIMPINSYVLVQPYSKNPFQKLEVTESGLIIPEYTGVFKNPDSGEEDQEENLSVQAIVVETSPLNKFVKPGDVVYYRRSCGVPIPFFKQNLEVVAEQQIQVVINSGLVERFTKINN